MKIIKALKNKYTGKVKTIYKYQTKMPRNVRRVA
jgi:hypothetical protein